MIVSEGAQGMKKIINVQTGRVQTPLIAQREGECTEMKWWAREMLYGALWLWQSSFLGWREWFHKLLEASKLGVEPKCYWTQYFCEIAKRTYQIIWLVIAEPITMCHSKDPLLKESMRANACYPLKLLLGICQLSHRFGEQIQILQISLCKPDLISGYCVAKIFYVLLLPLRICSQRGSIH